ncbi:hypothetical protein GQ43DRAFT_492641 [Delitschia confertaspora ATCC 74209]|uniref:Uncharacterized protein n=1 Tax=Delitschia confertaspora ATCC 74209 TaxID=1513339 RepID=A0A9P4MQF4_9PLEO|nr:hypothetical protein GQ43DRAFT_492641 [Delitschia confertaspora ATCC 74209]
MANEAEKRNSVEAKEPDRSSEEDHGTQGSEPRPSNLSSQAAEENNNDVDDDESIVLPPYPLSAGRQEQDTSLEKDQHMQDSGTAPPNYSPQTAAANSIDDDEEELIIPPAYPPSLERHEQDTISEEDQHTEGPGSDPPHTPPQTTLDDESVLLAPYSPPEVNHAGNIHPSSLSANTDDTENDGEDEFIITRSYSPRKENYGDDINAYSPPDNTDRGHKVEERRSSAGKYFAGRQVSHIKINMWRCSTLHASAGF